MDGTIRERAARARYDAVVIGAGPNGLGAAVELARAGLSVLLVEGRDEVGGASSSAALTLPGFVHDVGSAVHALGVLSPFFSQLPLADHGLAWAYPEAPLAHPFDDGPAVFLERSVEATAESVAPPRRDGAAYRRLMGPILETWDDIAPIVQGPLRPPRHPLSAARFGVLAIRPATMLARGVFEGERARALLAGNAAHSLLSLDRVATGAFALVLGLSAHRGGWPFPRGGAGALTRALAAYLESLGGEILTGAPVASLDELPPSRVVLCDVAPRGLLRIAGERLPGGYRRALERYRYGPAAFKLDWALDGPAPWRDPEVLRAGTVHLGGTLEEIAAGERLVERGGHPERQFVLFVQQTVADPSRAPAGKHTAWAYCHVPNGSEVDMSARIEAQVERFAPGFRDRVLARAVTSPADLERWNPNLVGGDVNGGLQDITQLFTRPVPHLVPYKTPAPGLYICSSSTPPGGAVHGLCGYFAARAALRYSFGR